MLSAKPEFIDLFVAIGRLGRSLGLHLLLASQRLEEGRLRGLESHLSYRVGLRTFSAAESRGVLGVPDAYELPPVPGLGFLKPDQSTLLRFKAAYVSGPPTARTHVRREEGGVLRTWALESPPEAGRGIPARQLVDHRLEYLVYEGPISGDRGTVRRVAEGTYRTVASEDGRLILQLTGDQLVGTLVLYTSCSGESSSADSGWTFWLGKAD